MKRASAKRRLGERAARQTTKRTLTVPIERIVPGGMGIGHAERMTVLLPFVAPGDTALVGIDRVRGNTAFASLIEVTQPGPSRTTPPCPHFGICGGCDLQQLTYEAQLDAKREIVKDCFHRIGGIELNAVELVPSPKEWGYRIRADWSIDPNKPAMGYHMRGSKEIFDVVTCPILDPALDAARATLHDMFHAGELVVGTDMQGAVADDRVGIVPRNEAFPDTLLWTEINGERYGFDAGCFFQTNGSILPEFVSYVVEQATDRRGGIAGEAVDLFCGIGLFTLPLARAYAHVTGVESHARSASLAHENAKAAGLTNVSISGLTVEQWLKRRGLRGEAPGVIVLDPPRVGLEPAVVTDLVRLGCERLVYVSCDPATLARDVKGLAAGGFELVALRAFDMFPQTHHVEVVATLRRANAE